MFLDKPLLAIFAHPDDESFLMGGTLALAAKKTRVKLVIATHGEKGRTHIGYDISDYDLGKLRDNELAGALDVLGVTDCDVLGYRDGGLDMANEKEIVDILVEITNDFNPYSIITFGPDGITGHRDHIVIGRCATKAAAISGREVFWMADPKPMFGKRTEKHYAKIQPVPYDENNTIQMNVGQVMQVKEKAMACHASQAPERFLSSAKINIEYFYKVPEHMYKL